MPSEETVPTIPSGTAPPPSRFRRMALAYLLMIGAIVALEITLWHRDRVEFMREQYQQDHGEIDIPEALYFDSMACSVQIPAVLIWFVLQLTSACVFCFNRRGIGYFHGLLFLTLWLAACGFWFG